MTSRTTVQLSPSAVGAPASGGTIADRVVAGGRRPRANPRRDPPAARRARGRPRATSCRSKWAGAIRSMSKASRARRAPRICRRRRCISVSEGYFEAMGAQLSSGRAFTAFDNARLGRRRDRQRVLRARFLADGNPIGQVIRTWATGIGPLGTHLKSPPNYRPPPEGMPSEVDRRGEGRAQRAARPGGRAGDLLHDAPVSVLGGLHRGAGRRCAARRRRRSAMRFAR